MLRFSNKSVRDLAWVIASPPLISGDFQNTHWWSHEDCLSEFQDCLPTLIKLDKDPSPLTEHLSKLKSGRLGFRFESFVAYWLTISPNFELLTQNLQIIELMKKGSHTHGELDFIVRDTRSNQVIHLEVAVKFYLGSEPFNDPFRWFGSNTQDQLGKKVEHLQQHQTQLSDKFTDYLNKLGYHIDIKQCFLKGRLFYPQGINTPPQGVTENHLRGRWVQPSSKEDQQRTLQNDGLLFPIHKQDWLAELNVDDLHKREPKTEFPINTENAQCYIHSSADYKEIERIFCLPKNFSFPLLNE